MTYFGLNKVAEALSSLILSAFGGMSVHYTARTICLVTIELPLRNRKMVAFAVTETDFSQSINSTLLGTMLGMRSKDVVYMDGQMYITVEKYNL